MLIVRLALAYICGAIYKFRVVVEHLIHFCRGRAYINGNVDHNVVKPRGTIRVRIIKSNVSFTCAGVQEIKDYFAYFKYRAVFLMQSKYLLERKLTELREPNLYLQA